jgi:hypothetical protein
MSLAYEVLRYVSRARQQPADAGDPNLIRRLEVAAKRAWEGIVALHAPASPMTWQTNTIMAGNVQTSNRTSFRFPRPVEIVGFLPVIITIPDAVPALATATTDALQISIDTDNQNYLTSGDGVSTNAGGNAGPYVSLSAMSVQVPRIVGYKLENPTPDIGFHFRWALDVSAGAIFHDCIIGLAMYARYL